jgi:hypothetical protein
MATQPRKLPTKKPPETPRKARQRQPSTSDEEAAAATSLPADMPEDMTMLRTQIAQLNQAVTILHTQQQQHPLLQSPTRSQRQRMATPDSASRRRLLSPEPDLRF